MRPEPLRIFIRSTHDHETKKYIEIKAGGRFLQSRLVRLRQGGG